jgi:hypothetical protein
MYVMGLDVTFWARAREYSYSVLVSNAPKSNESARIKLIFVLFIKNILLYRTKKRALLLLIYNFKLN